MADPNAAINFVEYMKGVGDAVGNMAKEGAYGVYDFGQVVVGGSKILTKEGLGALGAKDAAAAITIEDIEPLSALGKVAVQGGYEGLGNAIKSMPANVANAVTDAAGKGDMRALGSAVTDAVFLAEGARAGAVGAVKGAAKGVNALKSLATSEAKAVPKVVPTATPKPRAKPKAWGARKNAKKTKNQKTSNKACPSCQKKNDTQARFGKTKGGATKKQTAKASLKDFSETVDDFNGQGKMAEKAYELYKNEEWAALEKMFTDEKLNNGWPPNRGAISTEEIALEPGAKIDRYGGYFDRDTGVFRDKGTFSASASEPFENRALPMDTLNKPYKIYEVQKRIPNVQAGEAIPWFEQPGKGIQYELPRSVEELVAKGYLKEVK
jgi:hypothetical protein